MRILLRSMAAGAIAIVIFAIGVSMFEKAPKVGSEKRTEKRADTLHDLPGEVPQEDVGQEDVDALAKAKIEILKKQGHAKAAGVGSSPIRGNTPSFSQPLNSPFDARKSAADTLSRLIEARKCERLTGAIGQSSEQSMCPTGHPLSLANPSGYSDLLAQTTVNELAFLKQLAIYARSENQSDPFDLAQVAKVYVRHPNDNVKEQALEIAALMQPRDGKEALTVAIKAVELTVSGPLAHQALSLMSLHRDHDPHLVDKTVAAALKSGGWHVRDAVASQLLPFITPSTRPEFVQILAAEPARSKIALHIRLNLEEFDRMERL